MRSPNFTFNAEKTFKKVRLIDVVLLAKNTLTAVFVLYRTQQTNWCL